MSTCKSAMEMIKLAKKTLRKEIQEVLTKLTSEEKARQSEIVYKKLISMREYEKSRRISIYLSTADEINTLPILQHIFQAGKDVFVPQYQGKIMKMVKLHSMEDYDALPLTKWNIKQPADENRNDALTTGGLDLIILPGVAFTISGKRCGHGMGYYDKFLTECFASQAEKPFCVAVAFNEQIKDDIPTTERDVLLHRVITEHS